MVEIEPGTPLSLIASPGSYSRARPTLVSQRLKAGVDSDQGHISWQQDATTGYQPNTSPFTTDLLDSGIPFFVPIYVNVAVASKLPTHSLEHRSQHEDLYYPPTFGRFGFFGGRQR